jgi:predicted transcriptional regulator
MRRERYAILGDILAAIERAGGEAEPRVTAVAQRANLPHGRLMGYLVELRDAGLVTNEGALTPSGRDFLRKYREWCEVLERFGLEPPRDEGGGARL